MFGRRFVAQLDRSKGRGVAEIEMGALAAQRRWRYPSLDRRLFESDQFSIGTISSESESARLNPADPAPPCHAVVVEPATLEKLSP